jgi:hypothetical protein
MRLHAQVKPRGRRTIAAPGLRFDEQQLPAIGVVTMMPPTDICWE